MRSPRSFFWASESKPSCSGVIDKVRGVRPFELETFEPATPAYRWRTSLPSARCLTSTNESAETDAKISANGTQLGNILASIILDFEVNHLSNDEISQQK